jgi:hypothetical protein
VTLSLVSKTAVPKEPHPNQFIAQRAEIQQNPAINVQVPVTLTLGEGRAAAPVEITPGGFTCGAACASSRARA